MTPRLRFRQQARAEVLEARDWYDARSPGLGLEFTRTIDATLALVQRKPEAFTPIRGGIRQVVLRRFPYTILFAYEHDEIVVLTVHHDRQAPPGGRSVTPNKRMEPPGAIVLKEAGRLCPAKRLFSFSTGARGARVARGSCAIR
jgi:plasmid stabilization system protein ParE